MLEQITPLILTYNEAPNLERTLRQLRWANRIVVIDSYSTDETLEILTSYPQIAVYQREFDSFAAQCNYGLQLITTEWVLSLDADYVLTDDLVSEFMSLRPLNSVNAYWAKFQYCVFGKPLRGTLYPPRKVLYRHNQACYEDDGHAHHVSVDGQAAWLSSYILHDDRKPLGRWLTSQDRYLMQEAEKLRQLPRHQLKLSDRIRLNKILAPFLVLFYCLVLQRGVLDGWRGWYYALQRALAEILLTLRLIEEEKLIPHSVAPGCHQRPAEILQDRPPVILRDSE
jgi:glycosyltransferase involved in cell wall biosynthesis